MEPVGHLDRSKQPVREPERPKTRGAYEDSQADRLKRPEFVVGGEVAEQCLDAADDPLILAGHPELVERFCS